jgi:hypothetical protein
LEIEGLGKGGKGPVDEVEREPSFVHPQRSIRKVLRDLEYDTNADQHQDELTRTK